jgi:hypothetical protein
MARQRCQPSPAGCAATGSARPVATSQADGQAHSQAERQAVGAGVGSRFMFVDL